MVGSIILFVLAALFAAQGVSVFREAKSSIHEIEGLLFFLISAILVSTALILSEMVSARRKMVGRLDGLHALLRRSPNAVANDVAGQLSQITE